MGIQDVFAAGRRPTNKSPYRRVEARFRIWRLGFFFSFLPTILIFLALACGSDSDRSAGIIHRLLLAAELEDPGQLESFVGRLPEGLPVTPPLYPGADIVVSSREPASTAGATPEPGNVPTPLLYFIVLDTGASRADVFSFYEEELDKDPWQIDSTRSSEGADVIEFTDVEDSDISGVVSIAHGGDDNRTSVLISLQDSGAFREEEPPFELPESLALPKDFPEDIPLLDDAVITDSVFSRVSGSESYLVLYLTRTSQSDAIAFHEDAFREHGWTVTDAPSIALEDRIDFQDKLGDIQGHVIADRFPDAREYTQVQIEVRTATSREPSETPAAETPEEGATATP